MQIWCRQNALVFYKRSRGCIYIFEQSLGTGQLSILLAAIKGCSHARYADVGKVIHESVMEPLDPHVADALVDMYAKCGHLVEASKVFQAMKQPLTMASWNSVMLGYVVAGEAELALNFKTQMEAQKYIADSHIFVASFKACSLLATDEEGREVNGKVVKLQSLLRGRTIHSQATRAGLDSELFVGSSLVDMYARCGSIEDAQKAFNKIPRFEVDVVLWTTLILGYIEAGEGKIALTLFATMQNEGCAPNSRTFIAAAKACSLLASNEHGRRIGDCSVKLVSLEKGVAIHSQAFRSDPASAHDIFFACTLIDMYANCGCLVAARRVFDQMPQRNIVAWSAMILGYAENSQGNIALEMFHRLRSESEGPQLNSRAFLAALKACASLTEGPETQNRCLEEARALHSQASEAGFDSNTYVANALIDLYAKCGSLVDARRVFSAMRHHSVVSWNTMITSCVENGDTQQALELFASMQTAMTPAPAPNAVTYVAAIKACASLATTGETSSPALALASIDELREKGRALHAQAEAGGINLAAIASSLVDMHAKFGSLVEAHQVFDSYHRSVRDSVLWNALMSGYADNGEEELALELLAQMQLEGLSPDAWSFTAALKACIGLAGKEEATYVSGYELVKVRALHRGRMVHCGVTETRHGMDVFVANALVEMYARCGSIRAARVIFDRMPRHSLVSWNSMILGYARGDTGSRGVELYSWLKKSHARSAVDSRTYVAALKACCCDATLEPGTVIHADICRSGLETDNILANCLMEFYGKCGRMVDVELVFETMSSPDLKAWNTLLTGFGNQGHTQKMFEIFRRMGEQGFGGDAVSFVSLLAACSHAGLVERGWRIFEIMSRVYGIDPGMEHYACVIDMLARANRLEAAVEVIRTMLFEADLITWKTMLGACHKWRNADVGRLAFDRVLELEPRDLASYTLMANIYGSSGMREEQAAIIAKMNKIRRMEDIKVVENTSKTLDLN